MLISFFTARITLNALGIDDYGINNVVGGLVSLFSIFSNSMTSASTRFITYALGEGDEPKLNRIFSTTLNMHIILALTIVVLIEIFGVWFLNNKMVIPTDRLEAANWILQCSIIGFAVGLISIPYNACIIAHERMSAFAYMTVLDGAFKLTIAFSIYYYAGDRLILLAILGLLFTCINRILYWIYCKKHFTECSYHWIWNSTLNKKIFNFSGWNFIGAGSGVLKDQGVNILLNLFCGPAINAARGIAIQVNGIVTQFVQNFMMALNPQIIKSYAVADFERTFDLVFRGSRFSFYLLLLLTLPIILEADFILHVWLGIVPDYTVIFVRLILIYTLVESLSFTMITLMLATGNIRNYQIVVGGCQLLNFPISYIFLRIGFEPQITITTSIVIAILCLLLRFVMLKKMVDFPVRDFLYKVLLNITVVTVVGIPFPLLVLHYIPDGVNRLFAVGIISVLSVAFAVYCIGCTSQERIFVNQIIGKKLHASK